MNTSQITKKKESYTYDEVLQSSLNYFNGDELAATTWIQKYAMKSGNSFFERSPEDMFHRMARQFARIEKKYFADETQYLSEYGKNRKSLTSSRIFELFSNFKYIIPQGSVMAGLGNTTFIASLSNCVVLPSPFDSYGGILYTDQQMVQLFKRRCGVGFDLSTLRPSGQSVSNAAGTTTGAVSFMERFSNTTREVAQNGRRGALMLTMDIAHPNIADFITSKQDLTKITGANISVRLSDEFMKAVDEGKEFNQRWPIDAEEPVYQQKVDARELWNQIIQSAHKTAEPGIIYWDRQHYYSTSSVYPDFKNSSTNPCSEIAMQGGDSCRLMAVNLYSFVQNPFTPEASFDHDHFYEVVYEAQRLMDDLVDLELESIERILEKIDSDPEPDTVKQIERSTWELLYKNGKQGRRTGLGITGLADMLAALNIKFDAEEAISFTEEVMRGKARAEFDSSIDMAIERGKFKAFDPEIEETSDFVKMMKEELPDQYSRMMHFGRRNISISTVAPTGTISMLAQTSSGIEPVFMLSYTRRRKLTDISDPSKVAFKDESGDSWEEFEVFHPKLKTWIEISGINEIAKSPYAGASAQEIDWERRVRLQGVIQKYVTHSISSTVNLAQDSSTELVSNIYLTAWKEGLKGITIYRDGSRDGVLVSVNDNKKEGIIETNAPKRPKELETEVIRFRNNEEKWLAFVGILGGRPYEIFTGRSEEAFDFPDYVTQGYIIKRKGKHGHNRYDFRYQDSQGYNVTIEGLSRSFNQEYWNYARLISGVLRHGMPLPDVVNLVEELNFTDDHINTWKNGVARAMKAYIPNGTVIKGKQCPHCNDIDGLVYEEGCLKCKSCGYTKCG